MKLLRGEAGKSIAVRLVPIAFWIAMVVTVLWHLTGAGGPEDEVEDLSPTFGWTAYGTTSAGYAMSIAIGNALAEDGYRLRVIPAKNDVSRLPPLRAGRLNFSAMGIGSYLAQEGVLDFASRRWGPQPVRVLLMAWSDAIVGLPVTPNFLVVISVFLLFIACEIPAR